VGRIGSESDLSFLGVVGVLSDGRLGGILVGVMKIEKEKRVNKYRRPACMGNGIRDTHINLFQPPKVRVRAFPIQVVKVTHPLPALSSSSDLEIHHSHSY
jgi:hypothetical protein